MDCSPQWNNNTDNALQLTDNNMVAVAARIHDRALQLSMEQTKLSEAKEQLSNIQESERRESETNAVLRRSMLEATNSRNLAELKLYSIRDEINGFHRSIQIADKETESISKSVQAAEEQWKENVSLYSRQELEMDQYCRFLGGTLDAKDQQIRVRQERLDQLKKDCQVLKESSRSLKSESVSRAENIRLLRETEDTSNAEISELAAKVRDALAKRSKMRETLRRAQEKAREEEEEKLLQMEDAKTSWASA